MDLRFVEVDELLDTVNSLFYESDEARQQEWRKLEETAWLYHELQLEGVPSRPEDLPRALAGEEGADYCDRVLLEQIRRGARLLETVREGAEDELVLSVALLGQWQRQLTGEDEVQVRSTEGATEHYKHDVVPSRDALAEAEKVLERAEAARQVEHPLRLGSDVLYGIGKAWPFLAWSGSCARLAASAVLIGRGYPPLIVTVRERADLYLAYHYDPTRLEALVLQCVVTQLQTKKAFLEGKVHVAQKWRDAG